jgi:hypothetical protein
MNEPKALFPSARSKEAEGLDLAIITTPHRKVIPPGKDLGTSLRTIIELGTWAAERGHINKLLTRATRTTDIS